jgi:hypothetical protein
MAVFARAFTLEVDGRPTLIFEARNTREAQELCKEAWLRSDLSTQKSDGVALCDDKSKLTVRLADSEEAIIFSQATAVANSSGDLVLAYLVDLDNPS